MELKVVYSTSIERGVDFLFLSLLTVFKIDVEGLFFIQLGQFLFSICFI